MATKRKTPEPAPPAASPAPARKRRTPAAHSTKVSPQKSAAKVETKAAEPPAPAPKRRAPARKKAAAQAIIVTREEIAMRAYSYWEARGKIDGFNEVDWFRAEHDLRREREAALAAG
ncbi:MAG: DUF2934 domain-containing protein [Bryobacterales bacterium]|nr:DUF2934 domain-containing protein [Bryobacterales bacterium]